MSHGFSPPPSHSGELVGHLGLHGVGGGPLLQIVAELRQVEEVVQRRLELRGGAGHQRARRAELGGVVGGAAGVAVVARLLGGPAARAGAAHVPVGQEQPALGVVELLHLAGEGQSLGGEPAVDQRRVVLVLGRVGAVVIVVADVEAPEVVRRGRRAAVR